MSSQTNRVPQRSSSQRSTQENTRGVAQPGNTAPRQAPLQTASKATPFSGISFRGTFRSYQQDVLDNAQRHLKDGKLHIVAAPGSGKTVLGLELIRRLNSYALVLSPSVTIRQQWGERFMEKFAEEGKQESDYISYDLKKPAPIISVTYQALHAAVTKQNMKPEEDADILQEEQEEDFCDFNIFETLRKWGVRTICLDEAHHLKREWQKALEQFVETMQSQATIVALTATPPYDSTPAEWNRYISICGEIDEEIFVPRLVAQNNLCPHQDYIYFNFPTDEETEVLNQYRIKARDCAKGIIGSPLFARIAEESGISQKTARVNIAEIIPKHREEYAALISAARQAGIAVSQQALRLAIPNGEIPNFRLALAEKAFRYVLDSEGLFSKDTAEQLNSVLSSEGLVEKRKVYLLANDKLNKMLFASMGKLKSILDIASVEYENMAGELRMLILTDYVKRELFKTVGTEEKLHTMGAVPIFESVRRHFAKSQGLANPAIAMLTGPLVIAPQSITEELCNIAVQMGIGFRQTAIENTAHAQIYFSGSNKNKVSVLTEAFGRGLINILIGTKSLLGEGWDSPCINSLILASFVGSFMLSNQMRGRAIRTDRRVKEKASSIWHLVTVEPPVPGEEEALAPVGKAAAYDIPGGDYTMLKRRFSGFLAPAYNTDIIESGVDRIDILQPPYDKAGVASINAGMLKAGTDRKAMARRWNTALNGCTDPEILDAVEVSREALPKPPIAKNVAAAAFIALLMAISVYGVFYAKGMNKTPLMILAGGAGLILLIMLIVRIVKIIGSSSREKLVKAYAGGVLTVLRDIGAMGMMGGKAKASVAVLNSPGKNSLYVVLTGTSVHDKRVFAAAMAELLSRLEEPRYVLIKKNGGALDYENSVACPSVIGAKKEYVELLCKRLSHSGIKYAYAYTRNENGARVLSRCLRESVLNTQGIIATGKKIARTTGF